MIYLLTKELVFMEELCFQLWYLSSLRQFLIICSVFLHHAICTTECSEVSYELQYCSSTQTQLVCVFRCSPAVSEMLLSLGRVLNRFSKDIGFMDDLLPYHFNELFSVSIGKGK